MARPRQPLTQEEIGRLIAFLAVLLGAFLYLYPPYLAGFPINDGGLFYTMMRAIQANGFRLPETIHYNGLNIPFAYPPLGFYVGAALSTVLHVDPLLVLRWFPAIVLVGVSIAPKDHFTVFPFNPARFAVLKPDICKPHFIITTGVACYVNGQVPNVSTREFGCVYPGTFKLPFAALAAPKRNSGFDIPISDRRQITMHQ